MGVVKFVVGVAQITIALIVYSYIWYLWIAPWLQQRVLEQFTR